MRCACACVGAHLYACSATPQEATCGAGHPLVLVPLLPPSRPCMRPSCSLSVRGKSVLTFATTKAAPGIVQPPATPPGIVGRESGRWRQAVHTHLASCRPCLDAMPGAMLAVSILPLETRLDRPPAASMYTSSCGRPGTTKHNKCCAARWPAPITLHFYVTYHLALCTLGKFWLVP